MSDPENHLDDLLPFYINGNLPPVERQQIDVHLEQCRECRAALGEWQALAQAVQASLPKPKPASPSLSPLVRAQLTRRLPLKQALAATFNLVWAQRVFVRQGVFIPTISVVVLLGALAANAWQALGSEWAVMPLFAGVPLLALLAVAFVYNLDDDPALEIVGAMPTAPGTLIYARLTFTLGSLALLATLGTLSLAWSGKVNLVEMVAAWLAPMLWLSGLTTLLSLYLPGRAAAGAGLVLWGGILIQLVSEMNGVRLAQVWLLPLLTPGWALLAGQLGAAGIFWLTAWWVSARRAGLPLSLERGR